MQASRARHRRTLTARRSFGIIVICGAGILSLWLAANWGYQVIRKPAELFFPVSGALSKTPAETWRQYALALAADLECVRAVSPRIERGRHVPDDRWNVPRSAALLHP
jgi:hypothetical protein